MNIIRTKVVELSEIPAIAYKIKLKSGGSGIKMHRTDREETAFAQIDKRTGMVQTAASAELFPIDAFEEALDMLSGLPYSARGKVKIMLMEAAEPEEIEVPEDEAPGTHSDLSANVLESDEFVAIAGMYSDLSGKMNYPLMNKQFIQFAARSKAVAELVAERAKENDILLFIIKNRASYLAGTREFLTDDEALALIETIEEIDPRSAFKELKLHIRKMLAR